MIEMMSRLRDFVEKSHLFIACCAALLSVQSFFITLNAMNWPAVALTFFATLAIYNLSVVSITFIRTSGDRLLRLHFEGDQLNVVVFLISIPAILSLLPGCSHLQALIFMAVSVMALFYMMPVKLNNNRLPGIRHHWLIKNILLSLIWSMATVLIPLAGDGNALLGGETIFVLARNFFFIYALTVIYDLRDLQTDAAAGMRTLAMVTGSSGAKLIALLSLMVFAVLAFADPLMEDGYKLPLIMSFLPAAAVVLLAGPARKRSYYLWAVDGMMALKALLVIMVH
jgi:4-hydroxybenzoate polyprenyltransferase